MRDTRRSASKSKTKDNTTSTIEDYRSIDGSLQRSLLPKAKGPSRLLNHYLKKHKDRQREFNHLVKSQNKKTEQMVQDEIE